MTNAASIPSPHLSLIDRARGLAIALVFAYHSLGAGFSTDHVPWSGWVRDYASYPALTLLMPAALGWCGVPIFFAVSGFCIHVSHRRMPIASWRLFFVRRAFRIYPPYVIALLFFAFLMPGWKLDFGHPTHALGQLASHLLLLHNFDHRTFFGINWAYWSIAIEAQLYLLYPALLWLVRKTGWTRALWLLGAVELVQRVAAGFLGLSDTQDPVHPAWLFGGPQGYWFSWAIGAKVADDWLDGRPSPLRSFPPWLLLTLLLVTYSVRPLVQLAFPIAALASAAAIARGLDTMPAVRRTPSRVSAHLEWVGTLSYSLYLLHQPFVQSLPALLNGMLARPLPTWLAFCCCLLLWIPLLVPSWLAFRYIEQPSIRAGTRAVRRMREAMSPSLAVTESLDVLARRARK